MTVVQFPPVRIRVVAPPEPPALPAWLQGAAVHEWVEVPNSRFDQSAAITGFAVPFAKQPTMVMAYSGGCIKPSGSELFIVGGGHTDYAGNEVYSIPLGVDAPAWVRHNDPTPQSQIANQSNEPAVGPYYGDGRPISRHTYWNLHYDAITHRLLLPAASAPWGEPPNGFSVFDAFDIASGDYLPAETYPSGMPSITGCPCVQDADGNIWTHDHWSGQLKEWTRSTNSISTVRSGDSFIYETAYCVDKLRNRMFRLKNSGVPCGYFDLSQAGAPFTPVTLTGSAAPTLQPAGAEQLRVEMIYDPIHDAFYVMPRHQNNLYRIDAETFEAVQVVTTGVSPSWDYQGGNDFVYGRFNYCPELKGIVLVVRHDEAVKFIRTA